MVNQPKQAMPFELTGNANDEFHEFTASVWAFAQANPNDVRFAPKVCPGDSGVIEGFALHHVTGGWAADVYADFVTMVLAKVPAAYPDGYLDINTTGMGKPNTVLVDFWHD